jgi:hypothetical protein
MITLTELEVVLGIGIGVLIYVIHIHRKMIESQREAMRVLMHTLSGVADKKIILVRDREGDIHIRNQEKLNGN